MRNALLSEQQMQLEGEFKTKVESILFEQQQSKETALQTLQNEMEDQRFFLCLMCSDFS